MPTQFMTSADSSFILSAVDITLAEMYRCAHEICQYWLDIIYVSCSHTCIICITIAALSTAGVTLAA